jgi:epoxyqueuosine reductase QueG
VWISRYAWGRDYHEVLRVRLEKLRAAIEALAPGVETRVYVDTGPVIERAFARYSGIGWVGKNTCILNEQKGSWFFLGVILTNLDLTPDMPAPDRCGSCTACLDACPTGALVEPYRMDATRCISYLTIELKGPIPVEFRAAVGNNVFGCDICQDVCPWNRPSSAVRGPWSEAGSFQSPAVSPAPSRPATTPLPDFQPMLVNLKKPETGTPKFESGNRPRPAASKLGRESEDARAFHPQPTTRKQKPTGASNSQSSIINHQFSVPAVFSLFHTPLASLAALTEDDFRRAFLHSPIKRAKYRGWLRNLCVAMGNSGDASFVPRLQEIASGEDAMLRQHAEWAISRLKTLRR